VPRTIALTIAPAASAALGTASGTIQLRKEKRDPNDRAEGDEPPGKLLPQTLNVTVNVWQQFVDPNLGIGIKFPSSWHVQTIPNSRGSSLYIAENTEEFPGKGITVTKSPDTVLTAVGELQSSLQLLSQDQRTFNGRMWTIYLFSEASTGQQFIAAFSTSPGTLYEVGGKVNSSVGAVFLQVLSTVTFP
jgi:hypothetical protein